jgi:peptide/nickel transport system ATP-binding protein
VATVACEQPQLLREVQPGHWVACHRVSTDQGEAQGPLALPALAT